MKPKNILPDLMQSHRSPAVAPHARNMNEVVVCTSAFQLSDSLDFTDHSCTFYPCCRNIIMDRLDAIGHVQKHRLSSQPQHLENILGSCCPGMVPHRHTRLRKTLNGLFKRYLMRSAHGAVLTCGGSTSSRYFSSPSPFTMALAKHHVLPVFLLQLSHVQFHC